MVGGLKVRELRSILMDVIAGVIDTSANLGKKFMALYVMNLEAFLALKCLENWVNVSLLWKNNNL